MPRGMIVARWDDRMGVTPEAEFPEGIGSLLEHEDLLTIFSTHAISEKAGVLAMRIKRLNIVSYYSGIPEAEKTEQYFVVVILEEEEDPSSYEERLTEISKLIINAIDKPGFKEMFGNFYDQLIKMEKITEEQRYAFIFREHVRRLLLQKLTNGPMTKEGLAKWISKEIDEEITDIDSLLTPLKKTDLIEEVNISKGKKVSLEYVFLIRDVAVIRVPNVDIFMAAKQGQMAEGIREKYVEQVEKFFKEYRISNEDAEILGSLISNPDYYEIINLLRKEYTTHAELPLKLPRKIDNLDKILKDLDEKKIITAIKDKKQRVWVFLLSDIKFPTFFPEYMIDVIRRRWKEGTIAKQIALKHLELLRAEFIAREAPKYRRKMLKSIMSFFNNAESLINKGQFEQAATIFDTMAGVARDMGERALGELLDKAGKLLREDKERYVEEEFPDDRSAILELINTIAEHDKEKAKAAKAAKGGAPIIAEGEEEEETLSHAEKVEKQAKKKKAEKKKKKQAAAEAYQEPEELMAESEEEYSTPEEPSAPPSAPPMAPPNEAPSAVPSEPAMEDTDELQEEEVVDISSMSPKELKQTKKELEKELKSAAKKKDYQDMAEIIGQLADIEEALGNTKGANELREKQNQVAIKALQNMRSEMEKEAKEAVKQNDLERALELYSQCREISDKLFKSGVMSEAENSKKFSKLEQEIRNQLE